MLRVKYEQLLEERRSVPEQCPFEPSCGPLLAAAPFWCTSGCTFGVLLGVLLGVRPLARMANAQKMSQLERNINKYQQISINVNRHQQISTKINNINNINKDQQISTISTKIIKY